MLKIDQNGDRRWYNKKNQLHREDGPAYECVDGKKCWFINGKRHREDGPAFEGLNGFREWNWNGKEYTEKAYKEKV